MVSLSRDYFSSLPPELISWIFDFAYPLGEPSPTGPLSKHLLPYYYQSIFRSITLDDKLDASPSQLSMFATYKKSTRRLHLVERAHRRSEQVDHDRIQLLRSLVTTVPRLERLELSGKACDLVTAIFGGSVPLNRLDSHGWNYLTEFTLSPPIRLRSYPLIDITIVFPLLAKLPSLTSLVLTGWYSMAKGEDDTDDTSGDEDLVLKKVERLALDGPDAFETWSIPEVINRCPSLLHLDISGSTCGRHCDGVNLAVTRARFFADTIPLLPPRLKSLSITSKCPTFRRQLDLSLCPGFHRFLSLEHLRLGLACINFDQTILHLPKLRSLHLGRPNPSTFDSLHRLIHEGPGRHPRLNRITLDLINFYDVRSTTIVVGRVGKAFESSSYNENQVAPTLEEDGWVTSTERIAALEGELDDLLEVANRIGVAIEGEAIEAVEVLKATRAESQKRFDHNSRRRDLRKAREEKVREKMKALAGGRIWKIVLK